MMLNTVFIAGHARLPSGMAAQNMYEVLTITAEIDKKYGVVIEASCTLATDHGKHYIDHLLKGYSLRDGIEKPIEEIQAHYLGKAGSALRSEERRVGKGESAREAGGRTG